MRRLDRVFPNVSESTNKVRKTKKHTLPAVAAPESIPPNPKIEAANAIAKKETVRRSIG